MEELFLCTEWRVGHNSAVFLYFFETGIVRELYNIKDQVNNLYNSNATNQKILKTVDPLIKRHKKFCTDNNKPFIRTLTNSNTLEENSPKLKIYTVQELKNIGFII